MVTVESRVEVPDGAGCGERVWVKDRPVVDLVDLTCFGRPVSLRWRKHPDCPPEARRFGRTIVPWADQISAWHRARVSNRYSTPSSTDSSTTRPGGYASP